MLLSAKPTVQYYEGEGGGGEKSIFVWRGRGREGACTIGEMNS